MDAAVWGAVWPDWQFKNVIGRGACGVVYRAVRMINGKEEESAIKVVSLPQDDLEIAQLKAEGMTEEETQNYYASMANELYEEIQTMKDLNGNVSIVNVQDSAVIPQAGQMGWNILIRMECLTPFAEYIDGKTLGEEEVITLGIDLCRALEVCEEKHILHRDVKPENIFVGKDGHFKLGDFGIARQLEMTTGAYTRVGTPFYAAPEVAEGKRYDRRADIYSLGLVLYRLLNGGRLPFMPEKRLLTPADRRNALEKRLSGEAVPAPAEASAGLADVILKACAPKAKDRYENAAAFREALEGARRAAALPWRKRKGVLAAGILLALLLAGAGVLLLGRQGGEGAGSFAGRLASSIGGWLSGGNGGGTPVLPPETDAETEASQNQKTETPAGSSSSEDPAGPTNTEVLPPAGSLQADETAPAETEPEETEPAVVPTGPETTDPPTEEQTEPAGTEPSVPKETPAETQAPAPAETPAPSTAHMHSFSSWITVREPGCVSPGERQRTCSGCGETQSEAIEAVGHSFGSWKTVVEPGCETEGYRSRVCSRCGGEAVETIAAAGHSFGEWTTVREALCEEDGIRERSCLSCGQSEQETVKAPEHVLENGICTRCGEGYFVFTVSADGRSVSVGRGTLDLPKTLVIPAYHQGIPVTAIEPEAFAGGQFDRVELPDTLTTIGNWAFKYAQIGEITIPASVTRATDAFDCAFITTFRLGEGMTEAPDFGYGGTIENFCTSDTLTVLNGNMMNVTASNLYIGASVSKLRSVADWEWVWGLRYVESIRISPENPWFRSVGGCLIENATGTAVLIASPGNKITIPEGAGIRRIAREAAGIFEQYSIFIPDGVEEIEAGAIAGVWRTVSLPASLKRLGRWSITVNSGGIERIEFRGTMAQWEAVEWTRRYDEEPFNTSVFSVICTDGTVEVDSLVWGD